MDEPRNTSLAIPVALTKCQVIYFTRIQAVALCARLQANHPVNKFWSFWADPLHTFKHFILQELGLHRAAQYLQGGLCSHRQPSRSNGKLLLWKDNSLAETSLTQTKNIAWKKQNLSEEGEIIESFQIYIFWSSSTYFPKGLDPGGFYTKV